VSSVAKRRFICLLAQAQCDSLFLLYLEGDRANAGAGVGAVTVRLFFRSPAGAPIIGSGFDFEYERFFVSNYGIVAHHRLLRLTRTPLIRTSLTFASRLLLFDSQLK
jgi:hypothetical protein